MSFVARLIAVALLVASAIVTPLLGRSVVAGAVPDALACTRVHKMGLLEMFDLVDDLDKQSGIGGSVETAVYGPSLATGPQVTSSDQTAVEGTLDAFIACVNARDVRRLLSLLSQRYQASLVLDVLRGGDAASVIREKFPTIARADNADEPLQTPDIQRAWRPSTSPAQIWAVVSGPIPGYDGDVQMFVVFVPNESGWVIDQIASYEA